jgi:hypothetical protein
MGWMSAEVEAVVPTLITASPPSPGSNIVAPEGMHVGKS